MARLQTLYKEKIQAELKKEFNYKNIYLVPKLSKISLNIGVGSAVQDKKHLNNAFEELSLIAGQKPVIRKAKKSIAAYRLREGMGIGVSVILRRQRMYEFLDRLINVALPRVRDFRGLNKKSFDGNGNYNIGIEEQIIFPEINYDKVDKIRGLNITIVTTAKTDDESFNLLKKFNLPIN